MVTFSSADNPSGIKKKLKLKDPPRWKHFAEEPPAIVSREEMEGYQEIYICDKCRSTLSLFQEDEDLLWCPRCTTTHVKDSPDIRKLVPFDLPTDVHSIEPAVTSIDEVDLSRVRIERTATPKGAFAELQRRGLGIV